MGKLAGWEKHLYWYFIFPFFKGTVRGNGPETEFLKEQSQKYRLHKSELLQGCSSLLFHDNLYCVCSVSPLSFEPALPILLWKSIFESFLKVCSNALHVNMAVFGFQKQHQQTAGNYASSDWFVSYKMKAVWHTTEGMQPPMNFHRAELRIENNSHKLVSEENRGFIETFHTEQVELKEQSKQGILWLHWRYTDIKILPLFTLWYMWLERPGEFSFTCNWNMYLPSLFWKDVGMIASPLTLL